jgi:hypothetical protein
MSAQETLKKIEDNIGKERKGNRGDIVWADPFSFTKIDAAGAYNLTMLLEYRISTTTFCP